MTRSRRSFLSSIGAAGAGALAFPLTLPAASHATPALQWLTARGTEGRHGEPNALGARHSSDSAADLILLNSNENPYGPSSNAIDAVMRMFGVAARYPDTPEDEMREAIAAHHQVKAESVILGCGSTEILAFITQALTSKTQRLLTVAPTFETPRDVAVRNGTPFEELVVDGSLRINLPAMVDRCRDAGLIFICNPNNPTGTMHGIADLLRFVGQVNARSPESTVLVDEAYFEYVDDPAYGSAIPEAVRNPRLLVSRTFSKVYGMAGIRAGYAIGHPETIRRLQPWRTPSGISAFAAAAAMASLEALDHVERQRVLNTQVRTFSMNAMRELGFTVVPSHANFFLTDIRRDPMAFRAAMRARGVAVGRAFPPLTTYTRLSVGTMEEMQKAMAIAAEVLRG
ncbi:MAG: histidinol-phosphate aminotransferase family protein [Gemmatimonadaceae bacterium]|nr:histidinol-phosphate aminotransferase family protein [Gemmatimonadaceae bacterium]